MNLIHAVYEPEGEGPHPAIIALHGWGANALDLLGLAPYLGDGRFLVLCPQGAVQVPLGPMTGYGWFPLSAGAPLDRSSFDSGVRSIGEFVDQALQRYPIRRDKLVLLGFSQGGVMAYALGLSAPERFAGLVALSSWLPEDLGSALPPAERESLPTLVQHGTRDDLIPIERARESVETLRRLRVPLTYREFDIGHEIDGASLQSLSTWLADKVLSPIILAR